MKRENTMSRSHQFIATGFAILALGSTAAAAEPATRHEGTLTAPPTRNGDVVEITDLQPFTHIAYIPVGANLSSIKIEGVKAVKVATKRRSVTNPRYCDQTWSEPSSSIYWPQITDESLVPAFRVTYSYRAQPMPSDEYGSTYFTFSVYFRLDEISEGLRQVLSSSKISRTAASEYFQHTTSRDAIQELVIDEANSTFCGGNYADGNGVYTNPTCEDRIAYKKVVSPSPYITVNVEPPSTLELSTAATRL